MSISKSHPQQSITARDASVIAMRAAGAMDACDDWMRRVKWMLRVCGYDIKPGGDAVVRWAAPEVGKCKRP